jgi:hypothetical protein
MKPIIAGIFREKSADCHKQANAQEKMRTPANAHPAEFL